MITFVCNKCKYKTCVCAAVDGQPMPKKCPCNEQSPAWHISGGIVK